MELARVSAAVVAAAPAPAVLFSSPAVAAGSGGNGAKPATDLAAKPAAGDRRGAGGKSPAGSGRMAATGADPVLPWALGGSAVALAAGAGLVVAARRRRNGGAAL